MRGPQTAHRSDRVPRPHPHRTRQSLTWCQFCMERLILGTEPGCSLFMSLGREGMGGEETGTSISTGEPASHRHKRLILLVPTCQPHCFFLGLRFPSCNVTFTHKAKMLKSDNNGCWECNPEPLISGRESENSHSNAQTTECLNYSRVGCRRERPPETVRGSLMKGGA